MKLRKLLKDLPGIKIRGNKETEITGICASSKLVAPGNLFVAKKGRQHDGNLYIPEAITAGASAIVTDIFDPTLAVPQLIHPRVEEIEGALSAAFYQNPSQELLTIGVTGTNGKTTTTMCIKHLLDTLKRPCGLIGTIEYIIGSQRFEAQRTTPDVATNHRLLRDMVRQGCQAAVMEVTSHALDQNRVDQIDFDIAIFTNLTQDHLDYHGTMESYGQAKNLLFRHLPRKSKKGGIPPTAIINIDSPWHMKICDGCHARLITYALDAQADLRPHEVQFTPEGTQFELSYQDQSARFTAPMTGRFNLYNCLAAIAVGVALAVPLTKISEVLASFQPVSGRLQRVPNPKNLMIYVDYAHTEDALRNVLRTLREVTKGKLICVFGCGGDRDKLKRPHMGAVSEELADFTIITSDNPRSESPEAICRDIVKGFKRSDRYHIELDRRQAIKRAIGQLTHDDILLIAGKGHETRQVFAHQTIDFDDRVVTAEICQQATT